METLLTSDLTMFTLVVGFLAPLVIAAVQKPTWNARTKTLVTALFCVVVGTGTAYFSGFFTGKSVVSIVLVVFVVSITTYQNFWKKTGVTEVIETATSPSASAPEHAEEAEETPKV